MKLSNYGHLLQHYLDRNLDDEFYISFNILDDELFKILDRELYSGSSRELDNELDRIISNELN